MDYKIAFELALEWLRIAGVYEEVVNKASYDKAIKNKNYALEYIQALKLLRKAYLNLRREKTMKKIEKEIVKIIFFKEPCNLQKEIKKIEKLTKLFKFYAHSLMSEKELQPECYLVINNDEDYCYEEILNEIDKEDN